MDGLASCVFFKVFAGESSRHERSFPNNVKNGREPIILQCCHASRLVIDLTTHILSTKHPDLPKNPREPAL